MSIKECSNLPSTALPTFDIQPGEPSDLCVAIKLPRTYLDQEDIITHRRVAIQQGGTLFRFPVHTRGTWHYGWKTALRRTSTVYNGQINLMTLPIKARP